jgi:nitrogenase subunit NifH
MTSSCSLSIKSISSVVGVLLEDVINKIPTTDEIDLIEREQEEVINETPTTDEIDLIERVQEEVINKTPTTDDIDLVEREQ